MFLMLGDDRLPFVSIPRVSGDVSGKGYEVHFMTEYSPRERGCFPTFLDVIFTFIVFPA